MFNDEISPLSVVNCPRNDMVHITENMNEYELQFLEDAIIIQRNKNTCAKLTQYNVKAEYANFNDDGTVYNYYNYITVIHYRRDTVLRIHPQQHQIQQFLDMLANLNELEAVNRWLERDGFEEWQVQDFNRDDYDEWYRQ